MITDITMRWFLGKEYLFVGLYTHEICPNYTMPVAVRCGKGRIEYNPTVVESLGEDRVEVLLEIEVLRILLGHPYARKPFGAKNMPLTLSSDFAISGSCGDIMIKEELPSPSKLGIPTALSMEEYYDVVKDCDIKMVAPDEADQNTLHVMSGLWEEDEMMQATIKDAVDKIAENNGWGSLPGDMVEAIMANQQVRLSYRSVMNLFKASILSVHRALTRMRPSRRYGFDQMGSRYPYTTRLLLAIDTSSSIGSETLTRFLGIVGRLFKQGVESIEVIQFDVNVKDEVMAFKKAPKMVSFNGRGGTNFQAPIDFFAEHKEYDGLVFLTDGYASMPDMSRLGGRNVLWALDSLKHYEEFVSQAPHARYVCYIKAA